MPIQVLFFKSGVQTIIKGNPGDPGTPGTPADPAEPGDPGEPGTPASPGDPGEPGTPASPGDPGTPGGPGPAGPNPAADLRWFFDTATNTSINPGTSKFIFNNAMPLMATDMAISKTDGDAALITDFFSSVLTTGTFLIISNIDRSKRMYAIIGSITPEPNHYILSITPIAFIGANFSADEEARFWFSLAGPQGETGDPGPPGP